MMNEAFSTLSCSDFDVNSILMIFTSKLESTLKLVSGDPNEKPFSEKFQDKRYFWRTGNKIAGTQCSLLL
jgi:hypothetical protein